MLSSEDCNKLCCTKIENFSAHAGDTEIFTDVNMHIHCGQLTAFNRAKMEQENLHY